MESLPHDERARNVLRELGYQLPPAKVRIVAAALATCERETIIRCAARCNELARQFSVESDQRWMGHYCAADLLAGQ